MDYNIWYSGRWKNYINPEEYKGGLRIHLPEKMENSVRESVKKFCRFLRKEYAFPIRVQIYIKAYKNTSNSSSVFNIQKSWVNDCQEMRIKLNVTCETLKSEKEIFVLIIKGLTYYFLQINHIQYNQSEEKFYMENYENVVLNDYEIMKAEKGKYNWHLWTLYRWENYLYLSDEEKHDKGLRIRIDQGVCPELTHYYQWINQIRFTPVGLERQANRYAEYIVDDFVEYLEETGMESLFYGES